MKILIIANPVSGKGATTKRVDILARLLLSKEHDVVIYFTKYSGDAQKYISETKYDFDRLVIAGGDGTINEVINGISSDFAIPIMIVSAGNANLLSYELQLPADMDLLVDILLEGRVVQADYAVMNDCKFISVAGAGLDAVVAEKVKNKRKNKISNFSYLWPILKTIVFSPRNRLSVTVDGEKVGSSSIVIVSNTCNYAGFLNLAHNAGITTGCLDIIMLPKTNLFSLLLYTVIIKLFKVTNIKGAKYFNGFEVQINSDNPIPIQLDGDFIDRYSAINIKVIPKSLPIIIK